MVVDELTWTPREQDTVFVVVDVVVTVGVVSANIVLVDVVLKLCVVL